MNFKVFALIAGIILALNAAACDCSCDTGQPFYGYYGYDDDF